MDNKIDIKLAQNDKRGEFRLYVNDERSGEMNFIYKEKDVISVNHTGVHPELKGLGMGKNLMEEMVKFARENNLKVIPTCPYVKVMFDRAPEYQDLLHKK